MSSQQIKDEVFCQMQQLKKALDAEIAADLAKLRNEMIQIIETKISAADIKTQKIIQENTQDVKQTIQNTQLVSTNNAMTPVKTKQMVEMAVQKASKVVYKEVLREIDEKVMPKVNNMVKYVSYQMEDGQSVVTDYRHAINRGEVRDRAGLLTNGGDTSHIISENVSTFFTNDD